MTHALNAAFQPEQHPRAPAGSSTGGEFAPGGSGSGKTPTRRVAPKKPARRDNGTLSYDSKSNRGTGYDSKDGDPRVKRLQQALIRLGLTDSAGKPLKLDGKLGPKTTAAVRKAQHRMGVPVDGKVTPALLKKLTAAKTLTRAAAADPEEPYGPKSEVDYADPGYQPDGKARYPIDSEAHCRASWSYLSMPKNAAMYSAEQLANIRAKIKAAGRKYGIEFADEVKAAASVHALRDVELARPGAWKLSSGDTEFTAEMLRDAADFFVASGGQRVPIKLGHVDDRFDGEPTFGSVENVRYVEDERGSVLLGDIIDMPQWLAAAAPKRWPNRSIEGWQNFAYDGREYSLILSGLVFLGVTPPGVRNIKSLADLQYALAASSAQRVFASAPPDDPAEPPPDDPAEPPEAPPSAGLSAAQPTTPAPPAEIPHTNGAGMNLAKYREALAGLPDDASEEDVEAALIAAGFAPRSPAPPDTDALFDLTPEPELVNASQQRDKRVAAAAGKGGLITIDPAQLQEFRDAMVRASALTKRLEVRDRDEAITAAVKAGKFPPSRREHYERYWDADPVGAKEVIASLAADLVPVHASGYDTDSEREDDELDREIARLSGPRSQRAGA